MATETKEKKEKGFSWGKFFGYTAIAAGLVAMGYTVAKNPDKIKSGFKKIKDYCSKSSPETDTPQAQQPQQQEYRNGNGGNNNNYRYNNGKFNN